MAIINKVAVAVKEAVKTQPQTNRQFIGKGWLNTINKPGSPYDKVRYINMTLDDIIDQITIKKGEKLILFPNKQRPGKNDAGWRLSVVSNIEAVDSQLDVAPF